MTVGTLIWISIPSNSDQWSSKVDFSLSIASFALSITTNAVTTIMIGYKLWYVAVTVGGILLGPVAHHEVILQELSYIDREDSRLESTKESSADRIDSSRRIRSCFPRIPGQSLLYLAP